MLTVSLHGIKIHAPHGLYPQEYILGNKFEVDVDVWLPDVHPWPFADYTLLRQIVADNFAQPGQLLETFVANIHAAIKAQIPVSEKVRVAVRKMHPPMPGDVTYSQVVYEK